MATVKWAYPNGPKAPTQAQMSAKHSSCHLEVHFTDDDTPVDIVHNLQLDLEKPPEALEVPIVVVNPILGGEHASLYKLTTKDGNTLTMEKIGNGPGTNVAYDVWITRHMVPSWFGF